MSRNVTSISFSLLLAQGSLLVSPMFLEERPPEARALRAIVVGPAGDKRDGSERSQLSREEALALASRLAQAIAEGAEFERLAREHSQHPSAIHAGVLGTFWPGMLAPELDRFLFSAEVGEVGAPIEITGEIGGERGPRYFVLQRIEHEAACRQILVPGTDAGAREVCRGLLERLRSGVDFAELARERSSDRASAARGGALAIFVRGPEDSLVKEAAFRARIGEVVGPIESPLGLHLVKRVLVSELDPILADDVQARVRAILVAFAGARGAAASVGRDTGEAEALAQELAERIRGGEDMAASAREHDDDRGGRERAGDLGWVLRRSPGVLACVDRVFTARRGELVGPIATDAGWVLLRRER